MQHRMKKFLIPVFPVPVASAALVSHTQVQQELEWVQKDKGGLKEPRGLDGLLPILTKASSPHQPWQATRQLSTPFPRTADSTRGVQPEAAQSPWLLQTTPDPEEQVQSPADRSTKFHRRPFKAHLQKAKLCLLQRQRQDLKQHSTTFTMKPSLFIPFVHLVNVNQVRG